MPNSNSLNDNKKDKTLSLYTTIGIFSFICFVFTARNTFEDSKDQNMYRSPSSFKEQKKLVFKKASAKHKNFLLHQKIAPPISIILSRTSGDNQGNLTLIAKVTSTVDTNDVVISWDLPKWVQLISGNIRSVLPSLPAGVEKTIEITLSTQSEENQQVHVMAKAPYGEFIWSSTDQYNTRYQKEIIESKEKLVKRNADYIKKIEN